MSEGSEAQQDVFPISIAGNPRQKPDVPITTRLALEIPKPKDWQAFQRNCVFLFSAVLNDPHAQEYGRNGQKQKGIDILARRDGRDDHLVGVQCRLISQPLKESKILSDARAALSLNGGLKELIFATTAPDDTGASDAAITVTRTLKNDGHDITVVVYGWGQLQLLIAPHDVAYSAFHPSALASSTPQSTGPVQEVSELAALVAAQVVKQMRNSGLTALPREHVANADEDAGLHARIDTFRDLFKEQGEALLAERGLLAILDKEELSAKPWARYRLEVNLGSIALELGREAEAATRFEAAHDIRPTDPNALANLALARTIQNRHEEAMAAARAALDGKPRADQAIAYLLQAAARSGWKGEPENLIPPDLFGSEQADIGLTEFLRRRELPDWAERSLEIARRHPDSSEFKRIRAIAVLSLAIESGEVVPGGRGPVTGAELSAAADDMKAFVEQRFAQGFADLHDLTAYLNNAAMLLRLCERHAEGEALLVRGLPRVGDEPQIRRLLALAQMDQGRNDDALSTLKGDDDPENQLLRADLQANTGDNIGALEGALAVNENGLLERLAKVRYRIIGEAALRLKDPVTLQIAVSGLRAIDAQDISASLLEIKGNSRTNRDEELARQQLQALAASVPDSLDMFSRYILAADLRNQDLPDEASRVLEKHVDLSRPSPSTVLFLQCLAAARRDTTFREALAGASVDVREDPGTLWTVAAHSWNLGDLPGSLEAVHALLSKEPDDPRARLLKLEILIRQDRSEEIFAELEQPLEFLAWQDPSDQFRLASLLGHFGFAERAAALAYRLFLQHRDVSRAWMTLSMLVLDEGRGENTRSVWEAAKVTANTAVDLQYDDGGKAFFVIEPDVTLRKLDPDSWELDHALVRAVLGLASGDGFVGPDGRKGLVSQIRHKYVARLHYVMEHHELRFPDVLGFKSVPVSFDHEDGLDGFIAQVKARRDWIEEEESRYSNGTMPIGLLAHRLGMDTIEVGAGLASHDVLLKVATGAPEEREAADRVVRENARGGCVLDLLAFWTAWRLGALDVVQATCGPISLPQSVLDRLRGRRDRFEFSAREGLKSAGYQDGKIVLHEVTAEVVSDLRHDIERAIAWAEANTNVLPVVAGDDMPATLREHLRLGRSDIFDSLVLARQKGALLVTDDLSTRQIDKAFGGNGGAWLHNIFGTALSWRHLSFDQYVRHFAQLIDAGHNYLGVSGPVLAHAARLDGTAYGSPGYLFRTISRLIGGSEAEPISHIRATLECLMNLWGDDGSLAFRQPATGYLLRQLITNRDRDFCLILRTVLHWSKDTLGLSPYIHSWLRGHFILDDVLGTRR